MPPPRLPRKLAAVRDAAGTPDAGPEKPPCVCRGAGAKEGSRPTCQRLDSLPAQVDLSQRVRLCVSHVQAVALRQAEGGRRQRRQRWGRSPAAGGREDGGCHALLLFVHLQAGALQVRGADAAEAPVATNLFVNKRSRRSHLGAVSHALRPVERRLLIAAVHQPRRAAANLQRRRVAGRRGWVGSWGSNAAEWGAPRLRHVHAYGPARLARWTSAPLVFMPAHLLNEASLQVGHNDAVVGGVRDEQAAPRQVAGHLACRRGGGRGNGCMSSVHGRVEGLHPGNGAGMAGQQQGGAVRAQLPSSLHRFRG